MKDAIKSTITSEQAAQQGYRDMVAMMNEYGYCTIEIKAGSRSLSQNALYWEWLTEIAGYINEKNKSDFNKDDLHDRMRHDFLGYEKPKKVGSAEIRERLKTTTGLTTGEMFHFMEQIDAWAVSIGLYLPRPSDCQYEKIKRKHETGE